MLKIRQNAGNADSTYRNDIKAQWRERVSAGFDRQCLQANRFHHHVTAITPPLGANHMTLDIMEP